MDGDGVAMTRNHRAAVFTPITWEVMYERVRGPGDLNQRCQWCQDHCGVERADWDCRYRGGDIRRPLDSLHMLAYHQACKISHIM